ncbi:MAG: glycosyltransferase family 2 protein [Actinobacteria bacterium]|nr:glycosyltransferase family 2 protein [Actinomycetota bacterium]
MLLRGNGERVSPASEVCSNGPSLSVAVVICTHDRRRWMLLRRAVRSVQEQRRPAQQCLVVVDHDDALLEQVRTELPDVLVVANEERAGLAGARNTALRYARGDVVAFLDDDARADPEWLARLVPYYDDPHVLGVGGSVVPVWPAGPPGWFPEEFGWVVGCSWSGLPTGVGPVRNPIGAGMSFRRRAFHVAGLFTNGIGRGRGDAMGCEETEFTIRLRHAEPSTVVLYVPHAVVHHHVATERTSWAYFVARCRAEGRSKALVAAAVGSRDALSSERAYSTSVLPRGVARGMRDAGRGDVCGALRAGAIVAGLAATAAGYVEGRLRADLRARRLAADARAPAV